MGILSKVKEKVVGKSTKQKDREQIDQLKSYKKRFEPRWYLANAFYEGAHFTQGVRDKDGNWMRVPTPKGKVIREIPKAKKHLLNVRNMILKFDPKPVVYPDSSIMALDSQIDPQIVEKEKNDAINQSRYVEYILNRKMKLKRHLKKLVRYAELYHVAYIQIVNENGKKTLAVYDPFEISIYPTISNMEDYPVCVKHVSKRIEDLENDSDYDQKAIQRAKLQNEGKYSSSSFKDSMMKERYGKPPEDMVLIDELYKVVSITGEDGKKKKKCVIKSYIDTELIKEQVTELSSIPISMFCWGDEAYATSFMEDLMPLNKTYDMFISKLEQKVKKLDTGRIIMQKGEDTKVITTNDGEFIRYKRFKPDIMKEADVPNAFIEAVNLCQEDMREQGVSAATMSAIPQGVKAWRAIESLKESDYSSIGTQMDNLKECLTDLTEKLIDMIAYDLVSIESITIDKQGGQGYETIRAIGKRGQQIIEEGGKPTPEGVTVIDPNRVVKVEIESGLSYTEAAKKDLVFEMLDRQILPIEVAVDLLRVGNTQEIMDKLLIEMTKGKSIIDMPDFQMLPVELQQAIVQYLAQGGNSNIPEHQPDNTGAKQKQMQLREQNANNEKMMQKQAE